MRKLLVITLGLVSLVACSSSDPVGEVRTPAPAPEEPDRNIAEPQPTREGERAPSRSRAVAKPELLPNLARPAPIAMARVRGDEPTIAACGPKTCGEGEYCCNESCGICAPVGGACTQQACEPE